MNLARDEELCKQVEDKLTERGIKVLTGREAKSFGGNGEVEHVKMENGQKIDGDAVILSIGVKPNVQLTLDAGLKADSQVGIWVDDFMRTSD
ncbi:FAD-dependent oxidoreductase [Candidatus Bipolaricaulota bacterium]|nr:FAD-dependent oxidoreductase [Candidatus Bipolaricaulota bacterium]